MTLWHSVTHQNIWLERWCHTCFQPDEAMRRIQGKDTMCPILARAYRTGNKPPQWDRNNRADEMHRMIICNEYQDKPAVNRRATHVAPADEPAMFDVEPAPAPLVPVDGWPDPPTKNEVDHA